ncbi:MAG: hypothetical protein EOP67_34365 [Sphingomonas sp.]|nr:MAG: hypothetical protein EOP67_34365 [Sphingomonas sp.]
MPDFSVTTGVAPIDAAWLSVMPVTENNSMATSDTAALTQCQVCSCFSHHVFHLRRGFPFGAEMPDAAWMGVT